MQLRKDLICCYPFPCSGNTCSPVFQQVAEQILAIKSSDQLSLGKAWKVKLLNEAADDAGGVFDEVLTTMCMVRHVFSWQGFSFLCFCTALTWYQTLKTSISTSIISYLRRCLFSLEVFRGGSRTTATSKMESFVIIVNSRWPLSQSAPSWMLQQS